MTQDEKNIRDAFEALTPDEQDVVLKIIREIKHSVNTNGARGLLALAIVNADLINGIPKAVPKGIQKDSKRGPKNN